MEFLVPLLMLLIIASYALLVFAFIGNIIKRDKVGAICNVVSLVPLGAIAYVVYQISQIILTEGIV